MRPIEWYEGKFTAQYYLEFSDDNPFKDNDFIEDKDYPNKPLPIYKVISFDCEPPKVTKVLENGLQDVISLYGKGYAESLRRNDSVKIAGDCNVIVKCEDSQLQQQFNAKRDLYGEQRAILLQYFKQDLCQHYLTYPKLSDLCYSLAWERGHSDGLEQVKNCYRNICDVLESAYLLGRNSVTTEEKLWN